MSKSAKLNAILLLSVVVAAGVRPAAAQDRCEGTLCDWYYGSSSTSGTSSQPAATPAGAKPLVLPSAPGFFKGMFSSGSAQQTAASQGAQAQAAPAPSRVQVQGGGVAAMMRGESSGRCSGTLCDLYYGSSAPEPDEQAAPAAAASVPAPDTMDEGTRRSIRVRQAELAEAAKPRCATTHGDPWKCYR